MIRGTRVLVGDEAKLFTEVVATVRATLTDLGFEEIVLPALWDQQTFVEKAGPEIVGQMWAFEDKGGRPVCLHP